jgi:pimeloyl-ACP methyl ester carboxylesterase
VSESFAALDNEFAGIAESAATADLGSDAAPRVRRSSVTVPAGEHVSAVVWGSGPPEVIFLHEAGRSARAWDKIALALGRPSVAIDLPGHGRSGWRHDGRYEPRKLAGTLAETIRSLAPRASLVVGSGLGGRTALALITTPRPAFLRRLALIDTLPGTAAHGQEARLVQDPDGSWRWRHHVGNLASAEEPHFDDVTLWEELAGLAHPAFVIHGEHSSRLTDADLRDLERAPGRGDHHSRHCGGHPGQPARSPGQPAGVHPHVRGRVASPAAWPCGRGPAAPAGSCSSLSR